ncbi:hypothetical protein E2C01_094945 [Portunus trituberculatus]|uniref:Uncharacterized protein n=1 Tax=Portunus trituberculatus TaxID=210409 RepID=A0A5B7JYX6_PORTR|nr:hypothetical protein [Portunus trituberculatus]
MSLTRIPTHACRDEQGSRHAQNKIVIPFSNRCILSITDAWHLKQRPGEEVDWGGSEQEVGEEEGQITLKKGKSKLPNLSSLGMLRGSFTYCLIFFPQRQERGEYKSTWEQDLFSHLVDMRLTSAGDKT